MHNITFWLSALAILCGADTPVLAQDPLPP